MPDPTNESTRSGYAQQDAGARLLWQSQRSKANPWEHRGQQLDQDELPSPTPTPEQDVAGQSEPEPTTIAQQDRLRLHRPNQEVENPFESLIAHTQRTKLKHD
jgi:hypothetical protein